VNSQVVTAGPVVFDLFHTLVDPDDFRPSGFRRLEAAAAVLGVDAAVLTAEWDRVLPDLVRGRDSIRGMLRRVAHTNGRPARTLDIAPAAETLGRYQDLCLLHPRPAILEILDRLHDRPVGLLTNCHDRDVEAWAQSPIARRIDQAAFSTKIHAAKPDAAAYEWILGKLGVTPEEAVFVGNGGDNELAGAAAAGIGVIVHFAAFDDERSRVTPTERARRSGQAHVTVSSIAELAASLGVES
jgi:putative hydrolase of the HAD superfamily